MRKVAVFDFDGTLTTRDTFVEFIQFTHGLPALIIGFVRYAPLLVLMKLHLYPNWKAKQKVFSWFYKGWEYDRFAKCGVAFADCIERIRQRSTIDRYQKLRYADADVYVISASVDEWVRPFCEHLGVKEVLSTKVEIIDGKLTGRFSTKNCYGQEKVNRLLAVEPDRNTYYLYAFGDSRGDKEMIEFADEGVMI